MVRTTLKLILLSVMIVAGTAGLYEYERRNGVKAQLDEQTRKTEALKRVVAWRIEQLMIGANLTLALSPSAFRYGAGLFWHNWDMFYSLSKGTVFGFVIPLIASHVGLNTRGGAEGVGRATTTAVVSMTLSVLILDALFPPLMLN